MKQRVLISLIFLCLFMETPGVEPVDGALCDWAVGGLGRGTERKELAVDSLDTVFGLKSIGWYLNVIVNSDFVRLPENTSSVVDVLYNDYGFELGVKSIVIKTFPKHGSVTILANKKIEYSPNTYYSGEDYFTYFACNLDDECAEGAVDVLVDNFDFRPEAYNDTFQVFHDTAIELDVLGNDGYLGDGGIEVFISEDLHNGYAFVKEGNQIGYEFDLGFLGKDSLIYQVCDGDGDCSEAVVFIDVNHFLRNDFAIPNGISPNGDGLNDLFFVDEFEYRTNIQIRIFNRWGHLVFSDDDYQNNWDGSANVGVSTGKLLPSATYFYLITLEGVEEKITGYIYLN